MEVVLIRKYIIMNVIDFLFIIVVFVGELYMLLKLLVLGIYCKDEFLLIIVKKIMYFFDLFGNILVVLYFLLLFLCNDSYLILMVYLELDVLSDDRVMMYLFVIFFFGVIMIFGIFGNFLVLYIYCFDFKWKLVNNFIIIMVLFDFLVCGIVILLDIYDMCFYYIFFNFVVCKVF